MLFSAIFASQSLSAATAPLDKMSLSDLKDLKALELQLVLRSYNADLSTEERQAVETELAATTAKINELKKVDKFINPLPQEPIAAY